MLKIDPFGMVLNPRIKLKRILKIEIGDMTHINGIVVHQTDCSSAESAFDSFKKKKVGTHFVIDKDGTIYQTASIFRFTYHVGEKIKSRCFAQHRCDPVETAKIAKLTWKGQLNYSEIEKKKKFPYRYPISADSIGIEIVGQSFPCNDPEKIKKAGDQAILCNDPKNKSVYEYVTAEQNAALKWLIQELSMKLSIFMKEIYRHPEISYKTPTEARTAKW